ncbi:hypothetical protein PVK06_020175 [Gossypium arboreum]|uniref:RNase H type-1 domain-containing protein n=1 Tax=Gossypium arboreum TaxID=29729 RepID=A0ABR0PM29_GOSAR|nr:hypothetical protein PVK06_020175 [Gossypium arboreum]
MHNLVRMVVLAEAMAVLHGLQFARDMGFSRVILESDSKMVIRNLQASEEDYSETMRITWDVKTLARGFASCRFEFFKREGNTLVHAMASEAMKHSPFWVAGYRRVWKKLLDVFRLLLYCF